MLFNHLQCNILVQTFSFVCTYKIIIDIIFITANGKSHVHFFLLPRAQTIYFIDYYYLLGYCAHFHMGPPKPETMGTWFKCPQCVCSRAVVQLVLYIIVRIRQNPLSFIGESGKQTTFVVLSTHGFQRTLFQNPTGMVNAAEPTSRCIPAGNVDASGTFFSSCMVTLYGFNLVQRMETL